MKYIALTLISLTFAANGFCAQFGSLQAGAAFVLTSNGVSSSAVADTQGRVAVTLPEGLNVITINADPSAPVDTPDDTIVDDNTDNVDPVGPVYTPEQEALIASGLEAAGSLLNRGYEGETAAFPLDFDGNGVEEVAVIRKSARSNSFRMLVLDEASQILAKRNLLSGKFESIASFAAGDLDNDGADEVVACGRLIETGENVIQIVEASAGGQVLAQTVLSPAFDTENTVVCSDLDGDETFEIVVGGLNSENDAVEFEVYNGEGLEVTDEALLETAGFEFDNATLA